MSLNSGELHLPVLCMPVVFAVIPAKMSSQSVQLAFESSVNRWVGCDWATEFGILKLNLRNLRSSQLDRLAKATSGTESLEWRKAATWARKVEDDARRTLELARQARDAFLQHDLSSSIEFAERADQLELAWHEEPLWRFLLQAIQKECCVK